MYIIIFYIKFISFLYVMIFITANYESNKILNKKFFNNGERYTNYSIRPKILSQTPKELQIGNILFIAYWNFVFNITYLKILYGKWFFLKNIKIKNIIERLFLMYFGISKLFIKLMIHIFKIYKKNNIEDYLLIFFLNPEDNRIILRINNKWVVNNGWKILKEIIEKNIIKDDNFLSKIEDIYHKIIKSNYTTTTYEASFTNPNKRQIIHNIYPEISKKKEISPYRTAYDIAYNNNFYKKSPIIKKFYGDNKESTLIPEKKINLIQKSEEITTFAGKIYKGAVYDGYDPTILSEKAIHSIKDFKEIDFELENILSEYGLKDHKNFIFSSMLNCIDN